MTDDTEQFAQAWERSHGLPVGGRDPDEVRRELAIGRAARGLLLGRMTHDAELMRRSMALVLQLNHEDPDRVKPCAVLVPVLVNLPALLLVGAAREQFAEQCELTGTLAHAELDEVGADACAADFWNTRAVEAASAVLRGRIAGDPDLELAGWDLANAVAGALGDTTAAAVLIEPVQTLTVNALAEDWPARERFIDALRDSLT